MEKRKNQKKQKAINRIARKQCMERNITYAKQEIKQRYTRQMS